MTAYHAVTFVGKVRLGDYVGVYGVGGVGIYAVQFAKLCGANVIAIGRNREKLEIAKSLGADYVLDALKAKNGVAEQLRELTGGTGVNVMLDMCPARRQ